MSRTIKINGNTYTGVDTIKVSDSAGTGTESFGTPVLQDKTVTPSASQQVISADSGYDGLDEVTVAGDADLVAGNIKKDIEIFGVTGTYEGSTATQTKSMTLGSAAPATVTPDSGYALSSVSPSIDTSVIKAENIAEGVTMLGITGTHSGGAQPKKGGLCFTAVTAGSTIAMSITGSLPNLSLTYSTDEENWQTFTPGTTTITLTNVGDKAYFRGDNHWISESASDYAQFVMTGQIAASGNIQSLLDASLEADYVPSYCYNYMFYGCTSLTTAPALPATTLASYCYYYMFGGCTSLTTAPALPATTLASYCYGDMFGGCTSLTTAPALPATTLASYCYDQMFYGCTSLTTAPALPATTLARCCYDYMFYGCTSLATAPALPATTLASYCYNQMFCNCTSLTTAPALPATTLADSCYSYMFQNCTSLTTAPALPATTLADSCYSSMFYGCTSLATAPALPATTLADSCYSSMFYGCTSLTTAPALPATTLASYCYSSMFNGCSALQVYNTIGAGHTNDWSIPTSGTASSYTSQSRMFYGTTGDYASTNSVTLNATFYTQNTPIS